MAHGHHFALTTEIPAYLRPYIVSQDPSLYTPIDHASWRFIMRISKAFFAEHAHRIYLDGLQETGISTERIPLIEEMDHCLSKFNWRAVSVSGFIPPAVFMEFLSLGILPIACDMRTLEHVGYTPAPDIVHEAAGHAPIIADPDYSAYLRSYGEISQKAIMSSEDLQVYEAIRNLSDVKEDPTSTKAQIDAAQKSLDEAVCSVTHVSEATWLARMSWWTIEYGLVGDFKNPKIYGAGLLSSVLESYACFESWVKKIPFSVDCVDVTYDITKPQPQLFVSHDFPSLIRGLEELADRMAFRRGGLEGLIKARQAAIPTTAVLDTGIQISGTLARFIEDGAGGASYLNYRGPTQLSFDYQQIQGQGADYHKEGFGTPVGLLKNGKSPADIDLIPNVLEFQSGVVVEGKWSSRVRPGSKNLILVFEDCTVKKGSEILYQPSWGKFDMACGSSVVSVFGGAADREKYLKDTGGFKQPPGKPKTNLTEANRELNQLYLQVRKIRESRNAGGFSTELRQIAATLDSRFPDDWLLRLELVEVSKVNHMGAEWEKSALNRLEEISVQSAEKKQLIQRGLATL